MSRCLPLSLQLDGDVLETTLPGIVPLLSLIPRSVSDIPLAHNIIVFAHNVFLKVIFIVKKKFTSNLVISLTYISLVL